MGDPTRDWRVDPVAGKVPVTFLVAQCLSESVTLMTPQMH